MRTAPPLHLVPLLLVLGACTAVPPEAAPSIEAGTCRGDALAVFNGQAASPDLARRMLAASGARDLRWVQPGTMVTMDFRADRLTVHLDASNKVERANCG